MIQFDSVFLERSTGSACLYSTPVSEINVAPSSVPIDRVPFGFAVSEEDKGVQGAVTNIFEVEGSCGRVTGCSAFDKVGGIVYALRGGRYWVVFILAGC